MLTCQGSRYSLKPMVLMYRKAQCYMHTHTDKMLQADWKISLKLCNFRLSPWYKWYYTLFWGFTQRRVVIMYRRFGTACRYHLQGSRSLGILDPWTGKISRRSRFTWRTKWRTSLLIPNNIETSVATLPEWQHWMQLGQFTWFQQLCRNVYWLLAVW